MKRTLGALLLFAMIAVTPVAITPPAANASTADVINAVYNLLQYVPGGLSTLAPGCSLQVTSADAGTLLAIVQNYLLNRNSLGNAASLGYAVSQATALCQNGVYGGYGGVVPGGVYLGGPGLTRADMRSDK